jgi:flagellar assembly protein FliH
MPDSSSGGKASLEAAQPFLYAPPSGDRARSSGSDHAASDQMARQAYEKGIADGKASARAEYEAATADMRSQISGALRAFSKERAEYFGRVEVEVVRLSLNIAKKILHRESQIDPMVLTGVVHVALHKLESDTRVRMRTHPDEARFWSNYFQQAKEIYPTVEVAGDSTLQQGHCILETEFGTSEISLDTQLKEIEQGFFDLLERRPRGDE